MCCCEICTTGSNFQNALNRFRAIRLEKLKQECEEKDATIEDYKKQMEEMHESLRLAQEQVTLV